MSLNLSEIERRMHLQKIATFAIVSFLTLLSFIIIFTLTQENKTAKTYNTNAASISAQIYWGAYIDATSIGTVNNSPWDLVYSNGDTTSKFETAAGKGLSIIHWGAPWYNSTSWPNGYYPFPSSLMTAVRNHGSIPLLDWGSWDLGNGTANQPSFALKNIVNGATYTFGGQTFDQYITSFATAAKNWGYPFFLRFDWEMNGWWQFPWSVQLNGNVPQDYIDAWQHVHNIFKQVGATNVTWVWCPNISSTNTTPDSQVYPGDSFVDWTCLDGYNKDTTNWQTFSQVFTGSSYNGNHNSYQEIVNLAPTKPVMIGETASIEDPNNNTHKASWITDAFITQLPTNFPAVKAVVWFNWNDNNTTNTFPIESSNNAQTAFAQAVGNSSYYAANNFNAITVSPILPISPLYPTATPVPSSTPSSTPIPTISVASPSVTITYPLNGQVIPRSSNITFTAQITSSLGISRVQFLVNRSIVCTDTVSPYSCRWKVPGKKGIYTLTVSATNINSNTGTSAPVSFTVK